MPQYDLCILSIRHDAETARKLAKSIGSYRLPARVTLEDPSLDYRRILVDCDEEPFDERVRRELESCRFLVLLCSPGTKNNRAILDRLACFRLLHEGENIVPVIAEGEPADSFPESFIEKKTVQHIRPDMSVVERVETIEPVAADLRADTPSRWKEVLRYETVRIVASALGLHPDALEQRHRQRRKRELTVLLSVVGSVCLIAAAIFLRLGYIAKAEGDIAEEQTRLSIEIARRTMEELPESFAGDEAALEYIDEAVQSARDSLRELGLEELLETPAAGNGQG